MAATNTAGMFLSISAADENHVVTATPVITDADQADLGLGTVSYQWYVDGNAVGTDSNTYTPVEADEGKPLSVVATYTDVENHVSLPP